MAGLNLISIIWATATGRVLATGVIPEASAAFFVYSLEHKEAHI
jgi:hypothetical protein